MSGERPISAALFATVLAGCVLGPTAERPVIATPVMWKAPAPTVTVHPLGPRWWEIFRDAALDVLEAKALAANQDLVKAVARVEESRASLRSAGAAKYPTLELAPSVVRSRTSSNAQQLSVSGTGSSPTTPQSAGSTFHLKQTTTTYRVPLTLNYEVDVWGRIKRTIESAQAQTDAIEAARGTVELTVTTDIASDYFNLRAFDMEIGVLERTRRLRVQALEVSQSRLQSGYGLSADVSRADTELANVESDLTDLRRRRTLQENALAVLLGEPASDLSLAATPESLPEPPGITPDLPSELLLRRPDVAQAERTAAARCAEIGVAKAAFFPSLTLTDTEGFESFDLKNLFNAGSRISSFGPTLTLPLFSGKNRATLAAAEARYAQAVADYRMSVIGAFRDVEDALENVQEYQTQAQSLDRAVDSARRTERFYDQRLHGGLVGFLDVVDAERTLLEAERAATQNRGARYIATVQMVKALGGGWNPKALE